MPQAVKTKPSLKRAEELYRELESISIYDPNYGVLLKEAVLVALDAKRRERPDTV